MIWILLVIFQIKHFVADYPLQGKYMLGKFRDTGWILPLGAHCLVHALFTFFISVWVVSTPFAAFLALFDFVVHFAMDRIKASPNLLGRYKALSAKEFMEAANSYRLAKENGGHLEANGGAAIRSNTYFWWSLGLDQMVHHLTDIAIIAMLVNYAQ